MTQKQLQGDWEKKLNNGTGCYDFIFHSWRNSQKNSCLTTDFDVKLIFYKNRNKRTEKGDINSLIKLSSLINCVGDAVLYALQPLTCWHSDPSPTTTSKTSSNIWCVMCRQQHTHPARQQILYVLHHHVWWREKVNKCLEAATAD